MAKQVTQHTLQLKGEGFEKTKGEIKSVGTSFSETKKNFDDAAKSLENYNEIADEAIKKNKELAESMKRVGKDTKSSTPLPKENSTVPITKASISSLGLSAEVFTNTTDGKKAAENFIAKITDHIEADTKLKNKREKNFEAIEARKRMTGEAYAAVQKVYVEQKDIRSAGIIANTKKKEQDIKIRDSETYKETKEQQLAKLKRQNEFEEELSTKEYRRKERDWNLIYGEERKGLGLALNKEKLRRQTDPNFQEYLRKEMEWKNENGILVKTLNLRQATLRVEQQEDPLYKEVQQQKLQWEQEHGEEEKLLRMERKKRDLENERDPDYIAQQKARRAYEAENYTKDKLLKQRERELNNTIKQQKAEGTYNPTSKTGKIEFGKGLKETLKRFVYEINRSAKRRQGVTGAFAKSVENKFPALSMTTAAGVNFSYGAAVGLGLAKALKTAASAALNFAKVSAEAYQDIERTQTSMEVVYGNRTQMRDEFANIAEYATKSPFGVQDTADFAVLLKQSGAYSTEVLSTLKMIGDTAGGNSEKMKRIANNYAQILSVGKASMLDMRQFAYAGIPIFKELSKELKIDQTTLRRKISDGEVTAEVIERVFKKMTAEGGVFYQSVDKGSKTIAARKQNLMDIRQLSGAAMGEFFLKSLGANLSDEGKLESFFERLLTVTEKIYEKVEGFFAKGTQKINEKTLETESQELKKLEEERTALEQVQKMYNSDVFAAEIKELNKTIELMRISLYGDLEQATRIKSYDEKTDSIEKLLQENRNRQEKADARQRLGESINKQGASAVFKDLNRAGFEILTDTLYTSDKEQKDIAVLLNALSLRDSYVSNIERERKYLEAMEQNGASKKDIREQRENIKYHEQELEKFYNTDYIKRAMETFSDTVLSTTKLWDEETKAAGDRVRKERKKITEEERIAANRRDALRYSQELTTEMEKARDRNPMSGQNLYNFLEDKYKDTEASKQKQKEEDEKKLSQIEKALNSKEALEKIFGNGKTIEEQAAEYIEKFPDPTKLFLAFAKENGQGPLDFESTLRTEVDKLTEEQQSLWERNARFFIQGYKEYEKRGVESNSFARVSGWGERVLDAINTYGKENDPKALTKFKRESGVPYTNKEMLAIELEKIVKEISESSGVDKNFGDLLISSYEYASLERDKFNEVKKSVEKGVLPLWRRVLGEGLGIDPEFTKLLTAENILNAYNGGLRQRRYSKGIFDTILSEQGFDSARRYISFTDKKINNDGTFAVDWIKTSKALKDFAKSLESASSVTLSFAAEQQKEIEQLEGILSSGVFTEESIENLTGEQLVLFKSVSGYEGTIEDLKRNAFDFMHETTKDGKVQFKDNTVRIISAWIEELKGSVKNVTALGLTKRHFEEVALQSSANVATGRLLLGSEIANSLNGSELLELAGLMQTIADENKMSTEEVANTFLRLEKSTEGVSEELKNIKLSVDNGIQSILQSRESRQFSEFSQLIRGFAPNNLSYGQRKLGLTEGTVLGLRDFVVGGENGLDNTLAIKNLISGKGGFVRQKVTGALIEGLGSENDKTAERSMEAILYLVASIRDADEAMKSLQDTVVNTFNSSLVNGFADTFKSLGESLRDGAFNVEDIGHAWKNAAQSMLDSIGPAAISAGLTQIAAGHLGLGIGLVAAGGGAQFLSGLFSKEDENDENLSRLETLRDLLADMLKQARADAEYYDRNSRHRNAVASNESLSIMSVDDAVISPTGRIITTDPNDFLIATKTPETLGTTRSSPVVNFTIVNEGGQQLNVSKTETIETPNGIDIKAFVVAVTQEAAAKGQLDGAFSMMQARQQGRRVSY